MRAYVLNPLQWMNVRTQARTRTLTYLPAAITLKARYEGPHLSGPRVGADNLRGVKPPPFILPT
jgi:hypothetical protein